MSVCRYLFLDLFLKVLLFTLLFCFVYDTCMIACMSMQHVAYNAHGGHQKALNLLELEFLMIVSHVGAGGSDSCSLEDYAVLFTTESSP